MASLITFNISCLRKFTFSFTICWVAITSKLRLMDWLRRSLMLSKSIRASSSTKQMVAAVTLAKLMLPLIV